LSTGDLEHHAQQLGLDPTTITLCTQSEETRLAVQGDIEEGIRRGVHGTPTLFVNGERVGGARSLEWWENKVAQVLKKAR
jgi:protein-disulfide isomerase